MQSINLQLTGRSGCILEILSDSERYLVRKFAKNKDYSERLLLQANKQKNFIHDSGFYAPKVFRVESVNDLLFFDMEYIPGEKYSDYLAHCSVTKLVGIIENLIVFINKELDKSKAEKIKEDIFIHKIDSIRNLLYNFPEMSPAIIQNLEYLENNIPLSPIPIGSCHGDLTLSNIIFSNNRLYLIDFLDSFIESPLLDLVKLRQDTKFFWSLFLEKELPSYKRNKVIQILEYFDNWIVGAFKNKDYYIQWYSYLEKFNLLRILPYLNDKKEIDFIISSLKNT